MFAGTVSLRRVIRLSWMTMMPGVAVVAVTVVGMVVAGFSEALMAGRSVQCTPSGR